MGYDCYRVDNRADDRRRFDDDVYFRANDRDMAFLRLTMAAAGVLDEAMQRPKRDDDGPESLPIVSSEDVALVPAFKFESNEGWTVTPNECDILATALEQVLRETRAHPSCATSNQQGALDVLNAFARFNRTCIASGGYTVE